VIAGNGIVRVYSTEPAKPRFGPKTTEACLVRRGTRMTLVAPRTLSGPGRGLHKSLGEVALSGSIVAYVEGQFGVDSGCNSIVVAEIALRRVLRQLPDVGCTIDAGFIRRERVTDLVVGRAGSVAWILERGANSRPKALLVNAAAVSGAVTLLDEGADIGATSLGLSAGTLSWWHAGVRRAAPLPL
jgi:hypothetical protein